MHVSEGKPFPRLTLEECIEKLGGEERYFELDLELIGCREKREDATAYDDANQTGAQLPAALAAATGYDHGVKLFKQGPVRFNEKMFSCTLDFWRG